MKRINNSSQNIFSEIEGVCHEQKKKKNEDFLSAEVNKSRWEILIQNPNKNIKLLENEFKNLEESKVFLLVKSVSKLHLRCLLIKFIEERPCSTIWSNGEWNGKNENRKGFRV